MIAIGVAPLVADSRRDGVAVLHNGCGEATGRADEKGERQGGPHRRVSLERADTARAPGAVATSAQRSGAVTSKGMPAAANGMPAVPRARIVFKVTMCLVGLCVCGLLYGVQGNPMWLPASFYAVAWWALGFAAPPPARFPIRIALWSVFASCYLVESSWLLVPVAGVLLDLTCRLLWRTLPGLVAAEAAARAPEQSAFDSPSPMPHRKRTAALPRQKTD